MPIHLDSLSRRRFFQGAAVFTASGLGLPLRAATSAETWALLSDTHIASDPGQLSRGVNMSQNLEVVVAQVLEESQHLSGVIIDGDVALDDGQRGDYDRVMEILQPLVKAGIPVHFTLGNHDDRENFLGTYPELSDSSPIAGKHCGVIETEHANLVLIDTLRFVDKVEGEVGETQLNWISDYLSENSDKPSIIIGHHYPQVFRTDVIPSEEKIKISGLIDSDRFLEVLNTHSSAKAYLFGHSHRWEVRADEQQLHRVNLPPTSYVFDEVRPSGWIRATISPAGMKLELRSLDSQHAEHGKIHDLAWR